MISSTRNFSLLYAAPFRRTNFLASNSNFRRKCVQEICSSSQMSAQRSKDDSKITLSSLFAPVQVKPSPDDINVGAELTGRLNKTDLLKVINRFYQKKEIRSLASEHGLDALLLHQAYLSFRKFCLAAETLPTDLHVILSDILQGAGNLTDIYPYFLRHAKEIFPHLECMDDLKTISDLSTPANWYPHARAMNRKIIYHSGPTNSGKTYHALERFMSAKSAVYCGPLKLLATEVYKKVNEKGTPCDLVTGEERNYVKQGGARAMHVSCTVEMTSISHSYEVAVIDEIQMIKDPQRGWAWTRALLGTLAEEIHVCGEEAAIDLIRNLISTTGEDFEVRKYKRLTALEIENSAVQTLKNVRDGDCLVCFNKNDIYTLSRGLEALGREVAVIYGGLPPNTKLAQARRFNDPNDPCKILIATDAIGMGLNLSIRRVIFYSLIHMSVNEKGEKEVETISVSQALQIAGRAGRFNTVHEIGYVTTFKEGDLQTLKKLLESTPTKARKAGLHPTADQIELYSYHLPNSELSRLIDIFISLSTLDESLYFICNVDQFKTLADMIQHVPLPLRARYVFCAAPINVNYPFICAMYIKFARKYSANKPITFEWLCNNIGWPFPPPKSIIDLIHLELVFDVLDLYLWLSYRFMDLFPDASLVKDIQQELDSIIESGVVAITKLIESRETSISSGVTDGMDENDILASRKSRAYLRGQVGRRSGKGKLTEKLLSQGLLTPAMLEELKKEWNEDEDEDKFNGGLELSSTLSSDDSKNK